MDEDLCKKEKCSLSVNFSIDYFIQQINWVQKYVSPFVGLYNICIWTDLDLIYNFHMKFT